MRGALGGPRVLLRRLREVMAEPVSAQERLDKIVVLIAANMVAEVCSVYVLRVDGTLELYATEGLNRESVHQTVLAPDEGLVGLVASEANPINLSEAQAHPAFSFRPETGEEIYHSFLGVPVLRAGNTLGVLVVQNRARRTYTEEEEEALQTTAMVLAEMIASGELSAIAKPGAEPAARRPLHLSGAGLTTASRSATSCCTSRASSSPISSPTTSRRSSSGSTTPSRPCAPTSTCCSSAATSPMAASIATCSKPTACSPTTAAGLHKLDEAVMTGLTAEAAVERVQSDTRARMLRMTDPYLRERLHDLDDLANRLMRQLVGQDHAPSRERLPENAMLVARSMGPAALLDYDRKRLRGLILEEGGPTSHVAIVARALGIRRGRRDRQRHRPRRPGRRRHRRRRDRRCARSPLARHGGAYVERVRLRASRQPQYYALRDRPCVTKDGEKST